MRNQRLFGLPNGKSKQFVIARYREDLRWLKSIRGIPYIVYDKGNPHSLHHLPNLPIFPVQAFEGVRHAKSPTGRESHTYLYHILKNYDDLADITIFLQGNPIELEASNALDAVKRHLESDFVGIDFLPLIFPLVLCDKHAAPTHRGLPLERIFKRLFHGACPDFFAYAWGAMFCASKSAIQRRPRTFYEEMMQIVYEEPFSGYVYERLWAVILGCPAYDHRDSFPKRDPSSWQLPGLLE